MEQFITIEQLNTLLKKWNGKRIKIAKQELDDYDEVFLDLSNISYATNKRRIDDYEPVYTLRLNGSGQIENAAHHYEPLPNPRYEIPLEDTSLYQFDGERFSLITDRAIYTIEVLN
ncbi:hypothetical protein JNUCC74_17675 [Cerasibacillus sp. JNUCC 74]